MTTGPTGEGNFTRRGSALAFLVFVLLLLLQPACGPGDDGGPVEAGDGTAAEKASPPPAAAPVDLAAALAYAREIELPEAPAILDFHRDDAVFEATGTESFLEVVGASVFHAAGDSVYWLDLAIHHRAEPIAFHARGVVGGTGGIWGVAAQLKEAIGDLPIDIAAAAGFPDRFEVVRLGEEYWTRSHDDWSGPRTSGELTYLGYDTPVSRLSTAFQWVLWTPGVTPDGHEDANGVPVSRYRFVDDAQQLSAFWNALSGDLPSEPLPGGAEGELDLWIHDTGLVVRGRLRAEDGQGRRFSGTLDLRDFDAPVEIRRPS